MKIIFTSFIFAFSILAQAGPIKTINISVTEKGFEPSTINVNPGDQVTLKITRKTETTCATSVQVPDKRIKEDLPLNKTVSLNLGILAKGEIRFGCGMNMMESARIVVR